MLGRIHEFAKSLGQKTGYSWNEAYRYAAADGKIEKSPPKDASREGTE